MKKIKLRDSKGSITLFVLISVLFFAIILTLSYLSAMNKAQSQEEQIDIIKSNYEKNVGNEEKVYTSIIERLGR